MRASLDALEMLRRDDSGVTMLLADGVLVHAHDPALATDAGEKLQHLVGARRDRHPE